MIKQCLKCNQEYERQSLQDVYCIPCRIEALQDQVRDAQKTINHLKAKMLELKPELEREGK